MHATNFLLGAITRLYFAQIPNKREWMARYECPKNPR